MTLDIPQIALNDGRTIPQLGLGVWKASPQDTAGAVREALDAGYRHVDTAALYKNEEAVGEGLRTSPVAREDVFVTTKIWNDFHAHDKAIAAAETSLRKLGLDYVDLLLIHWPAPAQGLFVEAWRALIELRGRGLARSIGVSNFAADHLERIVGETGVAPVLNQIELHPYLQQPAMRGVNERFGVRTEAWSPLGQAWRSQQKALQDPEIGRMAAKYGKTPAQVIIRWHLDIGNIVIPKSVTPSRIRENVDVFDFALDADDLAVFASLNRDERLGPDPAAFG